MGLLFPVENKQTFDLTGKIEIDEKTRQNTENKQTFPFIFLLVIGSNVSLRFSQM